MLKIGGATSRKINFEHETPSSSSRPAPQAVGERGRSTSRLLPPGASSLHSGIVGLTTHNNNYRGDQKEISPLPSFTATERVGGAWRVEMPSPATIGGYDYYTTSETKQRKRKRRKQKNFDEKDYDDDGDDFRNTSSTSKPHTSTSVSTTTTRHRMLSPREFSKLRGEMLLSEMETLADAIGGDDSELFLGEEEEMYQKQKSPKKLSPTRRGRDFSSTNEMKSRDRDGAVVDESEEARSNIVRPRTAVISNHVLGIQRRIDRALEGLVGDEYSYDNDDDNEENPRSYHQNNYRNEESDGNDGYDEKNEQRRRRVEQLEPAKNLNANETTANSPRNVNLGSLSARMRNRSLALPFTNELSGKRLPFVAPTTSTTIAMKKIPNVPPPPPQQPQGATMSSLTSSFLTPRASGRLLLAATATLHEVGEMPRMGKSATNPTLNALKENFLVGGATTHGAQSARRPSKPPQPPLSSPPFSARGIPAGMSGASGIGGAASGSSRRKVSLSGYAKASTLLNSSRRVARDTVREGTVGGDLSPTVGYGIVETPLIVNHFRINNKTVGALDIDMDGNSKKISVRKVGGAYNMDGADHRRQVKMAESIKRRQEAYLLGPFGLLPKLDEVEDDSEGKEITATQKEEVEMTPKTNNLHAMYRQAMVMSGDPSLTHDKSFAPRYLANTAAVTAKLSRSPRAGAPQANKALAREVVRELQGVGLLPLPTTAPMVGQQTRGKDPLTGGGHPLATGSNTKSNKNGGNGIMLSQKDEDRHHEEKYEQEGSSQNTDNLEDLASVSIRGVRVADVTASEKGESSSINTPRTGAKEPTDLLKKQFSNCAPMRSSVSLSSSTVARFATSGPPSPMSNTIALLTKTPTPPPFLLSGGTATSFGSENTFRRTNKNNNTYNNGPLGTTDTSSGSKNSPQGTSAAIVPATTSTTPYTVDLHVSRPSPHPPGSSLATPPIALSLDPSVEAAVLGTLPPPPDPTEASELNPEWSEATSHVRGIVQTASVLPDHTAAMLLRDYHENAVLEGLRVSRSANGQIWSAREAPTMLAHQRVAERQQGLVGGGGGGGSPTSSVGTPRGRGLIVGAADTTRTHEVVGSGGSPQESSAKGPKRLSLSQSSALALSAKAESLLKALQEPK